MVNSSDSAQSDDDSALPIAQAELLQTVLEEQVYPWLPEELTAEAAAAYEEQAELAGQAEISDEVAAKGWQVLSGQLNAMWSELDGKASSGNVSQNNSLTTLLTQKFAERLPLTFLERIGTNAQQLVGSQPSVAGQTTGQALLEQMVACVQDLMNGIASDDLRAIGRPLALNMLNNGNGDAIESAIQSVPQNDWESLSRFEQARLSLAAARYAIAQAENSL
jgi:hypothetical protein